jgi:hypothetical protein
MRRSITPLFALFASLAAGCNGAGSSSPTDSNSVELALVGVPNVQLLDATMMACRDGSKVVSAIVTIKEIDAKVDIAGGHKRVALTTTPITVDLLKLDNKTLNTLGITTLPSGEVDELRLKLDQVGAYVVLADGSKKPLEVPNGGIVNVVGRLDLDSCASGIVILDFDPHIRTEHEHGRREYELSCVSHIRTEELKGGCGGNGGTGGTGGGGGGVGPDMANGPDMTKPQQQCLLDSDCTAAHEKCGPSGVCVNNTACEGVVCPQQDEVCLGTPPCITDVCFGFQCPLGTTCSRVDQQCH